MLGQDLPLPSLLDRVFQVVRLIWLCLFLWLIIFDALHLLEHGTIWILSLDHLLCVISDLTNLFMAQVVSFIYDWTDEDKEEKSWLANIPYVIVHSAHVDREVWVSLFLLHLVLQVRPEEAHSCVFGQNSHKTTQFCAKLGFCLVEYGKIGQEVYLWSLSQDSCASLMNQYWVFIGILIILIQSCIVVVLVETATKLLNFATK